MGTPTAPFVQAAIVEPEALADASAAVIRPQPRRWDLVLTIALIVVGTYQVFTGFVSYSDLPYTLTQVYGLMGYDGDYPDIERANAVGLAINIIQPVLLVIAILLSMRSLRRGRVTFYIPLIAGVVSTIVLFVFFAVLLAADPALMKFTETMSL
jgi:hypothetical protein